MSSDNPPRSVLLIGKSQLVLEDTVARLRAQTADSRHRVGLPVGQPADDLCGLGCSGAAESTAKAARNRTAAARARAADAWLSCRASLPVA
jgi:hypothetical protein